MEETTERRGRGRPAGVKSTHVMIRMPVDLLAQIDAYAETLEAQIGISDVSVSRAMAIRELCKKGLQSLQAVTRPAPTSSVNGQGTSAPQPTTQPAIPLALEPAPTTAPPVDVPQVSETPTATTPTPQPERHEPALKTPPALSEDIVKIVEARAQYDRLSEREFIQLLFDRGIYRHRTKDGRDVPLPHTTYRDWMKKAREAGLA